MCSKLLILNALPGLLSGRQKSKMVQPDHLSLESSDDYFAAVLREAFKTNRIKGRVVSVKEISGTSGLAGCDMCYLGEKAIKDIQHFIEEANAKGVLLVSHSQNFGRSGIHFNFYIEENQLKFEINEKSIKKGRFSVSHLLMKSSRISG
jgi:hypothetical protein